MLMHRVTRPAVGAPTRDLTRSPAFAEDGGVWTPAALPGLAIWLATPSLSPSNLWQDVGGTTPIFNSFDPLARWDNAAAGAHAIYSSSALFFYDPGGPWGPMVVGSPAGADNYLSLGTGWDGAAFTAYVLFTPTSDVVLASDVYGLFAIASSATSRFSLATGGAADGGFTVLTNHGSGLAIAQSTGNILAESLQCVTVVWSGTSLATYYNRTATATATTTSAASTVPSGDELRIGVEYASSFTSPIDGGLASFLLYHSAHDPADRGLVWDYLGVA